jgi:hypothetical protein
MRDGTSKEIQSLSIGGKGTSRGSIGNILIQSARQLGAAPTLGTLVFCGLQQAGQVGRPGQEKHGLWTGQEKSCGVRVS